MTGAGRLPLPLTVWCGVMVRHSCCSPCYPAIPIRLRTISDGGAAGEVKLGGPVFRQADRLDLWLFARWRPGAFDGRDYAAGGWKLAPEVQSVVVGHVQPTLVLEHEEQR